MRAVQPSTHAAQALFMPMGENVIGRLRPVPRTVPVRSIGFLSAPLESGGDSDLMLANGTIVLLNRSCRILVRLGSSGLLLRVWHGLLTLVHRFGFHCLFLLLGGAVLYALWRVKSGHLPRISQLGGPGPRFGRDCHN